MHIKARWADQFWVFTQQRYSSLLNCILQAFETSSCMICVQGIVWRDGTAKAAQPRPCPWAEKAQKGAGLGHKQAAVLRRRREIRAYLQLRVDWQNGIRAAVRPGLALGQNSHRQDVSVGQLWVQQIVHIQDGQSRLVGILHGTVVHQICARHATSVPPAGSPYNWHPPNSLGAGLDVLYTKDVSRPPQVSHKPAHRWPPDTSSSGGTESVVLEQLTALPYQQPATYKQSKYACCLTSDCSQCTPSTGEHKASFQSNCGSAQRVQAYAIWQRPEGRLHHLCQSWLPRSLDGASPLAAPHFPTATAGAPPCHLHAHGGELRHSIKCMCSKWHSQATCWQSLPAYRCLAWLVCSGFLSLCLDAPLPRTRCKYQLWWCPIWLPDLQRPVGADHLPCSATMLFVPQPKCVTCNAQCMALVGLPPKVLLPDRQHILERAPGHSQEGPPAATAAMLVTAWRLTEAVCVCKHANIHQE